MADPRGHPIILKFCKNVDIYFPQQDGTLATDQGMERFVGKLVLERRCLKIADAIRVSDRVIMGGGRYLPIWPDNFRAQSGRRSCRIIDATGRVAAAWETRFNSGPFPSPIKRPGPRRHAGISPACSGGYWVVGEELCGRAGFRVALIGA